MRGGCWGCGVTQHCSTARDCPDPARDVCTKGICYLPDPRSKAAECRASTECSEQGRCTSNYVVSFLGTDTDIECVAESADDCSRSRGCRERGACVPLKGRCVAQRAEDCKRSVVCENDDACSVKDETCVRGEAICDGSAEFSVGAWDDAAIEAAFESATAVAASERRLLLCRATTERRFDQVRLTFGEACVAKKLYQDHRKVWFAIPGVAGSGSPPLRVRFHDNSIFSKGSSFVRASVGEDGGYQGKYLGAELVCRAVGQRDAERVVAGWLRELDRWLVAAKKEKPKPLEFWPGPTGADKARALLERSAAWLGGDDAKIVERQRAITDISRHWDELLVAELKRAQPGAKSKLTIDGQANVQAALVCGEKLRTRAPTANQECAVEVRVHRLRKKALEMTTSGFSSDGLDIQGVLESPTRVHGAQLREIVVEPQHWLAKETDGTLILATEQAADERLFLVVRLGVGQRRLLQVDGDGR
jgi:hypothetical protein